MAATPLRPWSAPPAFRPAATPLLEAPPAIEAQPSPVERDQPVLLIEQSERRRLLATVRRDRSWQNPDQLLDEFHAQEVESWKQTPSAASGQNEPLLLEELLRLNIPEDSRLSPEMQRLLWTTKSDLPLAVNEQVLRYVNYFLGRGRNTLRQSLRRAGSYRPMISRILAEEGVPQDLIYLVQAESGFRPQARSPKRASGMWQFVAGRGREYGLNQNRNVDERLDPEKATRAAARHLADLYAQFGHWHLAMAGYNCGPGGVQRAVERTGYADYWEFVRRGALPRETSNYVPLILAMALLDKNAQAFHLDDLVPEQPINYDTIQTNARIGLGLVADATDVSVAHIKQLNPALLSDTTPDGPYSLRIPKDTTEQFEREIAGVPDLRRPSWRRHQVQEHETLIQIAASYKVRPQDIALVNHFGAWGPAPGERITIPVPFRTPVARTAAARPAVTRAAHLVHYAVRDGDSLALIAKRYRVTVGQLQEWNHLSNTRLRIGQMLSVRSSAPPVSTAALAHPVTPPRHASKTTPRLGPARASNRTVAAARPVSPGTGGN